MTSDLQGSNEVLRKWWAHRGLSQDSVGDSGEVELMPIARNTRSPEDEPLENSAESLITVAVKQGVDTKMKPK